MSRGVKTVSVSMSTKSVSSQTAGAVKGDESVTGERRESGILKRRGEGWADRCAGISRGREHRRTTIRLRVIGLTCSQTDCM